MAHRNRQHRRREVTRLVSPRILILCEGQTEEVYFRALKKEFRNTGVEIPRSKFNTPKQLVEEAIMYKQGAITQGNPYDILYVVFDYDAQVLLHEAFDLAKAKRINIAYSNPCFELWFLWHFTSFSASPKVSCKKVIGELKEYITKYKKAEDYSGILNPQIENAIANSLKIEEHWKNVGDEKVYKCDPYCDVRHLITVIQNGLL